MINSRCNVTCKSHAALNLESWFITRSECLPLTAVSQKKLCSSRRTISHESYVMHLWSVTYTIEYVNRFHHSYPPPPTLSLFLPPPKLISCFPHTSAYNHRQSFILSFLHPSVHLHITSWKTSHSLKIHRRTQRDVKFIYNSLPHKKKRILPFSTTEIRCHGISRH